MLPGQHRGEPACVLNWSDDAAIQTRDGQMHSALQANTRIITIAVDKRVTDHCPTDAEAEILRDVISGVVMEAMFER